MQGRGVGACIILFVASTHGLWAQADPRVPAGHQPTPQPPAVMPEVPPSDPEERAQQLAEDRREFLAVAPYISMRGPLTLEDTDKSVIIKGFENIDSLKQHRFSRQPLASVGRTLFDELDQYRKSVVPHLETPQFVKDVAVNAAADGELLPLVVVGAAELWSDWMQDVTLRSRQLERDQRCL